MSRNLRPPRAAHRWRAFTLVEVLIALAVLAIGITALVKGSADFARNAGDLKQRALARWVAENRLTELTLSSDWPATGNDDGRAKMGGVEWRWDTLVEKTPNNDIRHVVVTVRRNRDPGVQVRLEGFIGSPALRGSN